MKLYGGIDLHSNNDVIMLDYRAKGRVFYSNWSKPPAPLICLFPVRFYKQIWF
uniref:Uncharacterized protein n=1 Tax=Candidatus Kentrum sp. SD TaxID=2126332 RepID=A0A451BLN7_9GAMM|nr:MAG: hypothetical protein BECKSD772F_GA0070984_11671 [Candidatus Kentron sp. SD]VFK49447.1 MAG: hypothetical protein BECKSD772E_GA0070983_11801 [Candidatus Kentron sp. SD]VFK79166.1 MAG: hypothetical protein BECKSD772D_GA0070982_103813 [Candidatus Kentron sp. SD]